MRTDILFISHQADRSGAPLVALNLERRFQAEGRFTIRTVLKRGGELEAEFRSVGPTLLLGAPGKVRRSLSHLLPAAAPSAWDRARLLRFGGWGRGAPRLTYCNSAASIDILDLLPLHWPVLLHVHELDFALKHVGPSLARLLRRPDRFIAAARVVRDNLVRNHGVEPGRIDVIYEGIETPPVPAGQRDKLRGALGLPPEARVVAGAGLVSWRKGSDLFIQVARDVLRKRPALPVYFAWLGRPASDADELGFRHDVRCLDLESRVLLMGERADVPQLLSGADVLALTSREDPFPLVGLEASAGGTPLVCFDGAGGMPEFVTDGCGDTVPYLDIGAMSDSIVRLLEDERLRSHVGENAKQKVAREYHMATISRQVMNVVDRATARGREA